MAGRIGFVREKARKLLKDSKQLAAPIDLERICRLLGFQYIEVQHFPASLSALCIEQEGTKYAAVNGSHHPHRKRFSLAHELGHWVLGHTRSYSQSAVSIDNPPDPHELNRASQQEESEANEFAGELLVPLTQLKSELSKGKNLEQLSSHFNVSTQVVTIRMIATRNL
ncbi:MAG TPA: ImmA/IrrE family metallo-endopeptidase [Spirochaetia bacterium]|nr:ImmA/IrrE family metallo-endopeptidase [Spirochaetia bacterium]